MGMSFLESPAQWKRSWYIWFFGTPLSDLAFPMADYKIVDQLWSDWSPDFTPEPAFIRALKDTYASDGGQAAMGYYRDSMHQRHPLSDEAAQLAGGEMPIPMLYFHGTNDGCLALDLVDETALKTSLGPGGAYHFVEGAGHFMHLEKPEVVNPKVIVCVPSGITEVERREVRDSAETAGAKQVLMVAEPMAAAIGVGLPVETPTGNMVIDIGGGTTEIAVIALSGIVSDTSIRTGGDELDQAIVQFMRKNYNLLVGEPTAEAIKIKIGSAAPVGEEREMEVKGRDLVSGIPKTVRVHSSEIREAVQEPIQQIVDAVRRALEITPPELASDIVDRGIVMTGGGALIRGLDILLAQETGLPIHVDEDPLTCVVRGTGRILDDYEKYRSVLSV